VPLALREENVSSAFLKSCGFAAPFASAHALLMIMIAFTYSSRIGVGPGVANSTVWSSTRRGLPMAVAKVLKLELGSCARSTENTTSSAAKGVPSWNFTPFLRWKRQVVAFTRSHEVASDGTSFRRGRGR